MKFQPQLTVIQGGKQTLCDMLKEVQHKIITLNVVSHDVGLITSNTSLFAQIVPDEFREELMEVKSDKYSFFISKESMNYYRLERIHNSVDGTPIHYIFQYEL